MRFLRAATVLVAAASIARTWAILDALPEPVAAHFDAGGMPNGWTSRTGFLALQAGILALMVLVFVLLPRTISWMPVGLVSLPHREHWLAPERRTETMATIEVWMGAFGLLVVVSIAIFEELAVQANLPGGTGRLSMVPFWATLFAVLAAATAWTVRFGRLWRVHPR
jgi:uncharacterized membrane protein